MKSDKIYLVLFVGLISSFIIGVNLSYQFVIDTFVIPNRQVIIHSNISFFDFALLNLALIALVMAIGRFILFVKNHFTNKRLALINVGIAITGLAYIISLAVKIIPLNGSIYLDEKYAFYSSIGINVSLALAVVSTIATQLFWLKKIRYNFYWTIAIALDVIASRYF